jgi:hypothetical protein
LEPSDGSQPLPANSFFFIIFLWPLSLLGCRVGVAASPNLAILQVTMKQLEQPFAPPADMASAIKSLPSTHPHHQSAGS